MSLLRIWVESFLREHVLVRENGRPPPIEETVNGPEELVICWRENQTIIIPGTANVKDRIRPTSEQQLSVLRSNCG